MDDKNDALRELAEQIAAQPESSIDEALQDAHIQYAAVLQLCLKAGVFTVDEYRRKVAQITSQIDQALEMSKEIEAKDG